MLFSSPSLSRTIILNLTDSELQIERTYKFLFMHVTRHVNYSNIKINILRIVNILYNGKPNNFCR